MIDRKRSGASGSEKRQRDYVVTVRVSGPERAEIHRRADMAGLSVPSLIRRQILNVAPPSQRPRPNVETVRLAQLMGQLGQIGSCVNLIAEQASQGGVTERHLRAIEGVNDALSLIGSELVKAMGRGDDH